MSEQNALTVDVRTEFGKGFARRLRAAGKIPAVLYGHGTEPQHLALPGHETSLIVRQANAIITLDIEGEKQLALVKDVQRDPVRRIIEHIDLVVVTKGEKVRVEVPVTIEGDSFPGTMTTVLVATIALEVEATHIPEHVIVRIDGLEDGAQIHAKDVELPAGAMLADDPDLLLLAISVSGVGSDDDEASESASEDSAE